MSHNLSPSQFISLESIEIATPCRADWNKMSGDERSRFCRSCAKNVYNFSAMTREEAERLILEKEGNLCVRLHRRSDGTVITSDCPVGLQSARQSRKVWRAVAAAVAGVLGLQVMSAVTVTAGTPVMPANVKARAKAQVKPVKIPSKKKSYGNRAPRKPSRNIRPSGP